MKLSHSYYIIAIITIIAILPFAYALSVGTSTGKGVIIKESTASGTTIINNYNISSFNATYDAALIWAYNQTEAAFGGNGTFVPYFGATQDVDLGTYNISSWYGSRFGNITGGYFAIQQFPSQEIPILAGYDGIGLGFGLYKTPVAIFDLDNMGGTEQPMLKFLKSDLTQYNLIADFDAGYLKTENLYVTNLQANTFLLSSDLKIMGNGVFGSDTLDADSRLYITGGSAGSSPSKFGLKINAGGTIDNGGSGTGEQIGGSFTSANTINNVYGLKILDITQDGGGTTTNSYGLWIDKQTLGTGVNEAIHAVGLSNISDIYSDGIAIAKTRDAGYYLDVLGLSRLDGKVIINPSGSYQITIADEGSGEGIYANTNGGASQVEIASTLSGVSYGVYSVKGVNRFVNNLSVDKILFVDSNNLRVGIGTTTPTAMLQVNDSISLLTRDNQSAGIFGNIANQRTSIHFEQQGSGNNVGAIYLGVGYNITQSSTTNPNFNQVSTSVNPNILRVNSNGLQFFSDTATAVGGYTPTKVFSITSGTGAVNITGNTQILGNLSVKRYHWSGYDNSTQPFWNTSAVQIINISNNNDIDAYGIYVVGRQNLTFEHSGQYLCFLTPEFYQDSGNNKIVSFWYQKTNSTGAWNDVAWSNSRWTMGNGQYQAPLIPFEFSITNPAVDKVRFMWYSDSTASQIISIAGLTNPTRPAIPAIILNCQKTSEVD